MGVRVNVNVRTIMYMCVLYITVCTRAVSERVQRKFTRTMVLQSRYYSPRKSNNQFVTFSVDSPIRMEEQ